MKLAKWILPLLLLVGCGEQPSADQNPFGEHYDVESPLGLRIRYSAGTTRTTWSPESLDDMYRATAVCAQLTAPVMPMVIFQDTPPISETGPANGVYYYVSGGVIVLFVAGTLRHEALHHLMSHNNFQESDNRYHGSRLFSECA